MRFCVLNEIKNHHIRHYNIEDRIYKISPSACAKRNPRKKQLDAWGLVPYSKLRISQATRPLILIPSLNMHKENCPYLLSNRQEIQLFGIGIFINFKKNWILHWCSLQLEIGLEFFQLLPLFLVKFLPPKFRYRL